eukprot:scaffold179802_cov35-Tisochrysis_lutea.AAC.2
MARAEADVAAGVSKMRYTQRIRCVCSGEIPLELPLHLHAHPRSRSAHCDAGTLPALKRLQSAHGGRQQHLRVAAVVDADHFGEAISEHLLRPGAGHRTGGDDGGIIRHSNHSRILTPEEGDQEV